MAKIKLKHISGLDPAKGYQFGPHLPMILLLPWKERAHDYDVWASLVAQLVKNLPAMRETWVHSLGWEDPLEKGKATHSSILAWRIPWTV